MTAIEKSSDLYYYCAFIILSELRMRYKEEDLVYWNDPDDGRCSQSGIITQVKGDHYVIAAGNGSIIEAPGSELEPL